MVVSILEQSQHPKLWQCIHQRCQVTLILIAQMFLVSSKVCGCKLAASDGCIKSWPTYSLTTTWNWQKA